MAVDDIGAAFVRLGLSIGRHIPGYVDSYFGPAGLANEVNTGDLPPLDVLEAAADELAAAVAAHPSLQTTRREYLKDEVAAMRTTVGLLRGERLDFVEEVRALYGMAPVWVDEAVFSEAHRALAAVLPGSGPLARRVQEFREWMRVPAGVAGPAITRLAEEFRKRTQALFPLPADEGCAFSFVRDKPWTAYNWYLGGGRSQIEFDEDHPLRIHQLPETIAHESYPGHHTEWAIKEHRLYRRQGWLEHSVVLVCVPSSLVSEGIAEHAISMVAEPAEIITWYAELLKDAGLPPGEATRVHEFSTAFLPLARVADNQLLLLYAEGASDDEVIAYGMRYALTSKDDQLRLLRFAKDPLWRSYGFNYSLGYDVVERYLSAAPDRAAAFGSLLQEPVTPSCILAGTAGPHSASRG